MVFAQTPELIARQTGGGRRFAIKSWLIRSLCRTGLPQAKVTFCPKSKRVSQCSHQHNGSCCEFDDADRFRGMDVPSDFLVCQKNTLVNPVPSDFLIHPKNGLANTLITIKKRLGRDIFLA